MRALWLYSNSPESSIFVHPPRNLQLHGTESISVSKMATASKAPAASTPKHTMAAAPTPSPRPMGRPFTHKSPSIKTPASLHGHSHNLSTPSHPSSTPLAATALGEDVLAYNSPAAALIASIASQGLTPNGQDGLGISMKEVSTKEDPRGRQRNMEEESLRNLQEVQRVLKTRLAGRAICREGVQKIAQRMWPPTSWHNGKSVPQPSLLFRIAQNGDHGLHLLRVVIDDRSGFP